MFSRTGRGVPARDVADHEEGAVGLGAGVVHPLDQEIHEPVLHEVEILGEQGNADAVRRQGDRGRQQVVEEEEAVSGRRPAGQGRGIGVVAFRLVDRDHGVVPDPSHGQRGAVEADARVREHRRRLPFVDRKGQGRALEAVRARSHDPGRVPLREGPSNLASEQPPLFEDWGVVQRNRRAATLKQRLGGREDIGKDLRVLQNRVQCAGPLPPGLQKPEEHVRDVGLPGVVASRDDGQPAGAEERLPDRSQAGETEGHGARVRDGGLRVRGSWLSSVTHYMCSPRDAKRAARRCSRTGTSPVGAALASNPRSVTSLKSGASLFIADTPRGGPIAAMSTVRVASWTV